MKKSRTKTKQNPTHPKKEQKKNSKKTVKNNHSELQAERRARLQAEVAQQRYRDIVEGLDSTVVWEMGAESFQFTFVGQRAEDLLGYPLVQWYTEPDFWPDKLHPEDRERVLELFEKALEEGTDQRCDHRMIAADGRTVWFHTGLRPIREEGGTPMFRGLSVDMTSQREAQEAIRQSQERYQALVDSIEGIVWEADAETFQFRFVSKQAERLLGFPIHLWLNEPNFWKEHLFPEDLEQVTAAWTKGVSEKTGFDARYRMTAADGRTMWIRNLATVSIEKDHPIALRGLMLDISERVRVEEALKQKTQEAEEASRVKSDFLSVASHEIRTPLNAIVGYASLLKQRRIADAEKQKEMSERIYQNAKELLDLINRLLDLNKIEAGRMDLHAQSNEVSLSELVQQVMRDLRLMWDEKGLAATFIDDPTVPTIRSDSGKLRQVFTNLIANAVKFTEKGSITIRLIHEPKRKTVSVEIKDTGVGIPENELSRIFEPFYQGKTRPAGDYSGTGLGLSIVKKFVEYLRGSIRVASIPGVGSTFIVSLPYDIA